MNRIFKLTAAALLAVSVAGCSSKTASSSKKESAQTSASVSAEKEEVATTGNYTVYNRTGETVTELYIYQTGSDDKGENYAEGGLADGEDVVVKVGPIDEEDAKDYHQTVEFVTESGRTDDYFKTLSLEEAPLTLLAEDAMTGSTPFTFSAPEE